MDRPVVSPKLSLAVVAKGESDPAPFWAALKAAGFSAQSELEIILARDHIDPLPDAPSGIVQVLRPGDSSIFDLWGAAIAQARAPYVAILDIHGPLCADWLNMMLQAIRGGGAGYYGPVEACYARGDRRIIGYLVEYVQFHRPIAETLSEIPGNNLVVQRALLGSNETLTASGFSKTALLTNWASNPILINGAVVHHRKPFGLRAYRTRRYRHGRCYAANRVEGSLLLQRLSFALLTPFLPLLRVARIVRHTMRVPSLHGSLLRFLIPIILAETSWSWGELTGYLAGEGNCRHLLD